MSESSSSAASTYRLQDGIAGLSIAGLLLPEAVAYAGIAALPPQAGVIALFAGLLCYGLFGTSRYAIVSATSSSAAVLAASSATLAEGDPALRVSLAIGLVLITGVFFLMAGLVRLGGITAFIAKPILRGFAFGLAVIIILKQFASMAGLHPLHSDLIRFLPVLLTQITDWHTPSLLTGLLALTMLFALARFKHLPGALLVIVLGIMAGSWLDLPDYGIQLVGHINLELATPTLPQLSFDNWLRLAELGFAMVLILYAESYGAIRNFAIRHGDPVSPNRDLLVLGAANIASSLFQGMAVGAGYSATSANEAAGAHSRGSGLIAAVVILLIVLTVLPLFARIPEPVLAAIVIHAVSHSLRLAPLRQYFIWKRDRALCLAAIAGVLLLGILNGLLAAIALCLILMLRQMATSSIEVLGRLSNGHDFVDIQKHVHAHPLPGMLIVRPGEPLFFANADSILNKLQHLILTNETPIHTVIISLEESPQLDGTSLEALVEFCKTLNRNGQKLLFARLKENACQALQGLITTGEIRATLSTFSVDETVRMTETAPPKPPDETAT